jgi:hypothetical protein
MKLSSGWGEAEGGRGVGWSGARRHGVRRERRRAGLARRPAHPGQRLPPSSRQRRDLPSRRRPRPPTLGGKRAMLQGLPWKKSGTATVSPVADDRRSATCLTWRVGWFRSGGGGAGERGCLPPCPGPAVPWSPPPHTKPVNGPPHLREVGVAKDVVHNDQRRGLGAWGLGKRGGQGAGEGAWARGARCHGVGAVCRAVPRAGAPPAAAAPPPCTPPPPRHARGDPNAAAAAPARAARGPPSRWRTLAPPVQRAPSRPARTRHGVGLQTRRQLLHLAAGRVVIRHGRGGGGAAAGVGHVGRSRSRQEV